MASALLASRNEPFWGERKVYMRKTPNSNPNPKPGTNTNPNPNASDHASDHPRQFHPLVPEEVLDAAAVSDDSSSFNRKSVNLNHRRDSAGYIMFNISTYSKRELRELKRRLVSELEQVRTLNSRIESREIQSSARSAGFSVSGIYCGSREVTSSAAVAVHQNHLDSLAIRSADLFSVKEKAVSGDMTLLPVVFPREPKRLAAAPESEKLLSAMMKKCGQILTKLMKNKKSVWFNSPVDVVGMGLHDYFQIIKHPMDLGTVRSKLSKGLYPSPLEFAADVRLTFNNALIYNPEGHEVHKLADQFLRLFEGLFCPSYEKYEKQQSAVAREEEERHRVSSWSRAPVIERAVRPEPVDPVILPPATTPAPIPIPSLAPPPVQAKQPPLQQSQPPQQHPVVGRVMMGKQPKPKAKDANKRAMSFEEKRKLSLGLQSLPQEKMAQVLQIVRKRNVDPAQSGDEIELDIEMMDTETLWELDRFLCNCKKMMSKIKRKEAMASHLISAAPPAPAATMVMAESGDRSPVTVETPEAVAAKRSKKGDAIEEDVDIGDDMPCTNYPSVEIEKDAGYASSSTSSGSDSSSSSDSDSGSSGSDSDEDDAQSPGAGLRSPRN
ncbi:transcription factor GTE7-like [Phoenix dactylifera]|uniref:Transcription factor GTE7-like n=1 Tax=Phoenix dactylifera TaxID=42345 RepID=A0A8B7BPI3_PHODC|nr:transcription factor GTE7-like [Phoenix dactylifera]